MLGFSFDPSIFFFTLEYVLDAFLVLFENVVPSFGGVQRLWSVDTASFGCLPSTPTYSLLLKQRMKIRESMDDSESKQAVSVELPTGSERSALPTNRSHNSGIIKRVSFFFLPF